MTSPTLSIVHTEASCGWGGQEIRILSEARGMLERGHQVLVVANPHAPILAQAATLGIPQHGLKLEKRSLRSLRALRALLREHRPQVVNTHSSVDSWLSAVARLGLELPIVRTRHISAPVPRNPLSRWLYLGGADRVVTTGEKLRLTLIDELHADPAHFVSVPTGIDLNRFSRAQAMPRAEARAQYGIPADASVIGIAATLRSWKGHSYLIEAFEQLAAGRPALHLLIVGDGPQADNLRAQAAHTRVSERIHMPGQTERVPDALAAMDIFALPSYANEGVPQAIMQAMAMQLPVVSTRVGAIEEVVIDGHTGVMVQPQDSGSLAAALGGLIDDGERRTAFGEAARAHVEARFSIDAMLDAMQAIFTSVITGGR